MSQTKKELIKDLIERECDEYVYVSDDTLNGILSIASGSPTQISYLDRLQKVESELEDLRHKLTKLDRRLG